MHADSSSVLAQRHSSMPAPVTSFRRCAVCCEITECELLDGSWICARHPRIVEDTNGPKALEATLSGSSNATNGEDRIQVARDSIRSAMRHLWRLDTSIRCIKGAMDDADWDSPNEATDAMDHLRQALDALAPSGTRIVREDDPSLGPLYEETGLGGDL